MFLSGPEQCRGSLLAKSGLFHAAEAGLPGTLETPLAPLWGWLILSEIPRVATVAGGAIVLATLVRHLGRDIRAMPSER